MQPFLFATDLIFYVFNLFLLDFLLIIGCILSQTRITAC